MTERGDPVVVATFGRFDVAIRYASEIAASYARNDHDRHRRGVDTSGTRAILAGWDVWMIDPSRPDPVVRSVPSPVSQERAIPWALMMIKLGGITT